MIARFFRKYPVVRIILMLLTFAAGIALIISGWSMTGKLGGLCLMLVGVALLLTTLALYNVTFQ